MLTANGNIYSKYNPIKIIENISKSYNYIILGIGLGYELKQVIENTEGIVYVIDRDKTYYNLIIELKHLTEIINNPRVKFLFGDEYKNIDLKEINSYKIFNNENLTQIDVTYFFKVIKFFSIKKSSKHKISFYEHITIADDCIEALKNIGYEVVKMKFSTKDKMIENVMQECPDYIFTINLSEKVSEISNILSIPYIAWVVDVPAYSLYSDLLERKNILAFTCDSSMARELKDKGFKNIHYMPVAVNTNRLDNIKLESDDLQKYCCDVSFLGTTGIENEFNKYMSNLLSKETIEKIDEIFYKQLLNQSQFIIKDMIDNELIDRIQLETGYKIASETYLSKKAKLAFLLGRKLNEIQRINMVKKLSEIYNFYVYGDENWSEIDSKYIQYRGYAEHFVEMPKVFKCSKVNINYTRIYVEAGLPMRVFDILGSKGFLATNYKEDVSKYFVDGKDLVVYRDAKDLVEIINYYLNNEKERQTIILNGYDKVKKYHTYEKRLKEMMNISNSYFKLE
ncbi:glycosyltransferase [Clostridium bovifaecis]|uniref:Glycosyltransferase n=1 Tax=Clostridium bovifaecis TaxID=2184719 RepID=A0A6I6F360_9CLOT|nr:glycosyltransferase [Clostridium bovifaecis]